MTEVPAEAIEAGARQMWTLVGTENVADWNDLPVADQEVWKLAFRQSLKAAAPVPRDAERGKGVEIWQIVAALRGGPG
jgi:hypothetical protein